jgi:predicted TIM-barrel fold metal-dependent hydrolase
VRHGQRILDCDIHVIEPVSLWAEYLDPAFRARVPRRLPGMHNAVEIEGRTIPAHLDHPGRRTAWRRRLVRAAREAERGAAPMVGQATSGTRPADMLAAMDAEGIDVAVVYRTTAGQVVSIDHLDPPYAAALCRAYNRWLADFCSADAARLKPAALLPLQDVGLAVAEAQRAVRELSAVALALPAHPVRGRSLDARELDPLWRAAQDLDVAIAVHGSSAAYGDHLSARYLGNLPLAHAAGLPIELMLALGALLTGGALSRHPRLRCAFLEGGSAWLPWWLWALDERWEKWGDAEATGQKERPSELFERHCVVSVDARDPLAAPIVAERSGANVVISSDWPHDDSAFPHAVDAYLALPISGAARRRLLWENGARLYRIS